MSNKKPTYQELEQLIKKLKSEKKLNEAHKLAGIGNWLFNLSTKKVEFSDEMFHIWGFDVKKSPPEYQTIINRIHPKDLNFYNIAIEKATRLGTPFNIEFRICITNEKQKIIRSICKPTLGVSGKITVLNVVSQDITQQKKIEEDKLKVKFRLEKTIKSLNTSQKLAHVGSYLLNTATQKIEWSEETFHIWGFDAKNGSPEYDELINRVHIDDKEIFNRTIQKAIQTGKPYEFEHRICLPNGEQKTLRDVGQPAMKNDKEVINLVGTTQDITSQKLFEEAKIKHQRLKIIGEMSASIAHDFNNALQQMMGNLEVVKIQNEFSDNSLDRLNNIRSIIDDISIRVSSLQKFGDTEHTNDNENNENNIDINALIENSLKESRLLWKDNMEKEGLKITLTTDFEEIPKISCNNGELKSVLDNVIENSMEAMPKGGNLMIKTGTKPEGVFAVFTDTGIGMDKETQLKVFQPFFSTKGFKLGRGLGMSGAYSIIKKHGGDIAVKYSRINKGTTIEIIFPRQE